MKKNLSFPPENIDSAILTLRGQKVILDADLARIYGVPTKRLNEQVKRNLDRFPEDFMFRLSRDEWRSVQSQPIETGEVEGNRSQFATGSGKHRAPQKNFYHETHPSSPSSVARLLRRTGVAALRRVDD